jgi:hypothetical protein
MHGKFGEPKALILPLSRRSKKQGAVGVELSIRDGMTVRADWCGTCLQATSMCIFKLSADAYTASGATV